jgi:alpha-mannosidase
LDRKLNVHVMGNGHIDTIWFWRFFPETVYDCCQLTFTRATDNLRLRPEYHFVQSQAALYEATEKYFPELFAKMRKYIAEGRWEPVGGMYVEAEGGGPSGESFVRQFLYGKRYFRSKFGIDIKVGWLIDNWTQPWQLPQIMKKSGIDYYVFNRCSGGEQLFWWQSPDGSRVLACRPNLIPGEWWRGLMTRPFPDYDGYARHMKEKYGVRDCMAMIGEGDHGGGPTFTEIENLAQLEKESSSCSIFFDTPSRYFESVLPQTGNLPVVNRELAFELVGDLTDLVEIRKENRGIENLLVSTEKFAALAGIITGRPYPKEALTGAWRKVLFNQFHDVIGGSVSPSAAEDAHRSHAEAEAECRRELGFALSAIAAEVDCASSTLLVFNPLSWERDDVVEAEVDASAGKVRLVDEKGAEVPTQVIAESKEGGRARIKLLFVAEEVPSLGYRAYRFEDGESKGAVDLRATEHEMENDRFKLRISPKTGNVESIYDKANGREVLGGSGNALEAFEDMGDSEGGFTIGTAHLQNVAVFGKSWKIESDPEIRVVERGPVRAVVRVTKRYQNSSFAQDIILYSKLDRIDFGLTVDWHDIHRLIKVGFPLKVEKGTLRSESPFGWIARPQVGDERLTLQWIDLSNEEYGISYLNDSRCAYDALDNVIRLTVLRSPTEPEYSTEEGVHSLRYALHPHRGPWTAGVVRRGYEFNNGLMPVYQAGHKGKLPGSSSLLEATPENVILTALKMAEDGDAIIARLYEVEGKHCAPRITLIEGILSAQLTNLLEEDVAQLIPTDRALMAKAGPYEIVTLKLSTV